MKVVSSKPFSLAEVKEILEKREKEGALGYEQQQVLEHAKKFASEDAKGDNGIIKKLEENKKLNAGTITKIIDIKPKKAETLKAILLKDKIELSDDEIIEVLKCVNKA